MNKITATIIFFASSLFAVSSGMAQSKTWSKPYHVDADYTNHLVNKEGKHLFILNKTAWAYFLCKQPVEVLNRVKRDGANVIRVALEGAPYPDVLHLDMWPWGGTRKEPDWKIFNEKYWNQVEERIQLALKNDIGINLTLYFTLKPEFNDASSQVAYWKEAVKRLGKYPNILCWEIMNEYVKNQDFQDIAGTWFHENDPDHRPVISSDGTTDDAVFIEKQWMDMAVVHTCTGSVPQYDLEWWYKAIAQNTMAYGKPAFNNESGREVRHKNDDGVNRRKQAWIWSSCGAFFTFHTFDGCEGIDSINYKAPGNQFMKPYADFFLSIPFYSLYPNHTACVTKNKTLVSAGLANPSREMCLTYICTRQTGEKITSEKINIRLPDGKYIVSFINPANTSAITKIAFESKGLRQSEEINIPDFIDDILIKIDRVLKKEQTIIKGTE